MTQGMRRWMLAMIAVIFIITTVDVGMAEQIKVSGTMTGGIWPEHPTDDIENHPFKNMNVTIMDYDPWPEDDDELGTFTTNNQGFYNTGWINTISDSVLDPEAEVYLLAKLEGPHVKIFNDADRQNPPEYRYDYDKLRGEFINNHYWNLGVEVNAYYHTTKVHEFFTGSNYPFDYHEMTFQMEVHVEADAEGQCGQCTGDAIKLDPGVCSRTSDILYHEYTHNVIGEIYGDHIAIAGFGNIGNNPTSSFNEAVAMEEGICDYFAASINDDSIFGEGAIQGRDLNNGEHYPADWMNDNLYEASRIISGTFWDIRQELGQSTTDQLIFRALREFEPISFEQMHYYMLSVDDDNANLDDGTPNGEKISEAFDKHGMDFIGFTPQEPWFFEQFNSDSVTEIPFGGITNERTVVMKASVESLGVGLIEPNLQLEVEVQPVGTAFDGEPTCTSGPAVVPVSTAYATCSDLPIGEYHWQARVRDVYGVTGPWRSAGDNPESDPDFEIINSPPNQPTSLTQYKSDGITGIPLGGTTVESVVVMKGGVSDLDGDNVQLEVEVRPVGTPFSNTPTCTSDAAVASGDTASATCTGLANGQYHWQARAKDSNDATGLWLSAGGNPETSPDFEVRTSGRSGGPDDFGYTFTDSNTLGGPAYGWIEISGTGTEVLSNSDDSWVEDIGLGFFFNYYGTDYSQLAISNNGLLFSGGTTWQYVNTPITQTPGVHGFIAPFWDDIITYDSRGAGTIYYQTLGNAPNRMFVVEWYDNKHYSNSDSGVTFEAILYEGSNNILFQYKDVDFGNVYWAVGGDNPPYDNGGSATVGIEGPAGDDGLQYSFNEQVIDPGLAIRFKFPQFAGTNLYLSKQAPASKDHGSAMTYTLHYHNFGDTPSQNVVLEDTLPAEVEFISASDSGSYDSNTRKVTWNIGSVTPSGHGYETVSVRIPQGVQIGTVIQNDASISTSNLEVRYDDNEAHARTTVTGSSLPPDVGVEPNNGGTGIPSIYWHDPITFSYHSCEDATGVDIRIHVNDGGPDIIGSMAGGPPDWTYTTTFYPRHGRATITYTIHGCDVETVTFDIYIDPAGYIYDTDTGERIAGATVWLLWSDGEGGWVNVPTGEVPPISQPDENPLITGADGQYQWDVLAGSYRVHVEAAGYYPADSIVVGIPPAVTDLHVGLTRIPSENEPPVATDDSASTLEDTTVTIDVTANDTDVDDNLDPTTANTDCATCSGPAYGTLTNHHNGTFTYTPDPDYNGPDSFIYEICDTEGLCDTATVTIDVTAVNDAPVISVDVTEQTVQYSDGIANITISATDVDSSSLTISTSWTKDGGDVQPDLPPALVLSAGECILDFLPATGVWILEGRALVDAGTYNIKFTISDGEDEIEAHTTLVVEPEDAAVAFDGTNPVAAQVAEPGGNSEAFSLTVDVTEAMPDLSGSLLAYPGDISLAEVSVSLVPIGPGSPAEPTSCSLGVVGTGYDAILTLTFGFNDVAVNTYAVQVTVDGGYYIGSGEDVVAIYDPSLGFTTGGGTFLWPETGEKTNFGYTMKYNKKATNIKGNLLLVRHLQDGTIYRVKSNALYGLALGEYDDDGETYGLASFSGKATYLEPSWDEPIGNYEFITYVEDHGEPGKNMDRIWIKIMNLGNTVDVMSMDDPGANNAVELSGGNIVVPHNADR